VSARKVAQAVTWAKGNMMRSKSIVVSADSVLAENVAKVPKYQLAEDDEWLEILQEEATPLETLWPDEFQRYLTRFYTYFKKTPFHARIRYGGGFICQRGKKKTGELFFRPCYPDLIAKMLEYERWQKGNHHKLTRGGPFPPDYWIAMNAGKRSTLKAIDLDNKDNILGYYRQGPAQDARPRPLVTMSLDHFQAIKRLYDAFPSHVWCVSSLTLGLHVWETYPHPRTIDAIHAANKPRLQTIGLGATEIHPMFGRPFRRPFGQDYFTITDKGLLTGWIDQLNYFENVAETPTFAAIYQELRSLLKSNWATFLNYPQDTLQITNRGAHQKYIYWKTFIDIKKFEEDLKLCDLWAEQGFPSTLPTSVNGGVALGGSCSKVVGSKQENEKHANCDVSLSKVCNNEWVQNCEQWAINGLPCHDSILLVVSQLARWFFFIEFWEMQQDERVEKAISLLTHLCLTKNNGFISRLEVGQVETVKEHIVRIVKTAIKETDTQGKMFFSNVRRKRATNQYRRVIHLEQAVLGDQKCISCPSPVGFTLCCSDLPASKTPGDKRKWAEDWVFEPDSTPLPEELHKRIRVYYEEKQLRLYAPTIQKLTWFLNYLWKMGGEARLGIQSLKKMGFSDYQARQHIQRLKDMGLITDGGYSQVAAISKNYKLSKRTMAMFNKRLPQEKTA
jgi:hypothetical protein